MMNGFISKTMTAVLLGTGLAAIGGCGTFKEVVDPCYPARYTYQARQETHAAIIPQVSNGHVLDQTVWNNHFDAGTDKLNAAGQEQLARLARRRPNPDPKLYLQTAQDLNYDPAKAADFVKARAELDRKRVQAVEKYLNAQTAGRPVVFEIGIHDPGDPSVGATGINNSVQQMYTGFRGNLPATTGASSSSGGGGASGGSSGGSGTR